ncbi:uncharacterized protein LOC132266459 [Cornus florida]|uniref:uncharacterized protein LOC132266459 n=1 Tax=Cornus florida TaxID=4283 RepID=UPI0028A2CDF4|nr:uncharacterized protein LOC132266459 [Cornus florida]
MASTQHHLLLRLSILLGLLAIAANARPGRFHPCKTLIFFTTTTTTTTSSSTPLHQNPNFPIQENQGRFLTFFFTEVRELDPKPRLPSHLPHLPLYDTTIVDRASDADADIEKRPLPLGFYSSVGASFRDRSKDVLSAVWALLLGVGCGTLTAVTIYIFWSAIVPNRFEFRDSDDEFDDDDNDDDDVKPKMGYVAIPAEAPLKPAKEVA